MIGPVFLRVPGAAVGKARARSSGRGNHHYTPAKTRHAQAFVASYMRERRAGLGLLRGPIDIVVVAVYTPPKSWSANKREIAMAGRDWFEWPQWVLRGTPDYIPIPRVGAPKETKADIDNISKLVLDAGNGTLWGDDARVCSERTIKAYGLEDVTYIAARSVPC